MTATATPIGRILVDRGLIAQEDLDRALELQRERRGEKLGRILVDMGYLAQRDLLSALSEQLGLPIAQLGAPPPGPELEGISPRFLRQSLIFPISLEEGALTLAMADPLDFETINAVQASTKLEVRPQFAAEQEILDAIDRYYAEGERQSLAAEFAGGDEDDLEHLRDMASEAPVIRL
ncbi:MAG: type II secretion system protein GspE, partial [Acidobacteriota bacterium]|nr:type II secretion system protein GspE [Acidobacteriota bacterium]